MARYNLLEEAWIPVIVNESGNGKKVSLINLFENSQNYISLNCDTKTQEFAVLRLLLAITQTVFSRFNHEGDVYECLEVDEKFVQLDDVSENNEEEDYKNNLMDTWIEVYLQGRFPEILIEYLEKWRDRFFLFDDKYPFYQVLEKQVSEEFISSKNPSSILGKNINRRISESNNKVALFSPKNEFKNNKEILTNDEIIRWLITFQGYTGLSDKTIFGTKKYKASKGWLFDIGGLYLSGSNLFETLMLNTVLVGDENHYLNRQKPCWEYTSEEVLERRFNTLKPDNLAELYTNWSRAVYIDPEIKEGGAFSMNIVKLPDIEHVDNFLEPMTIWRFNKSGENKDHSTPRKHPLNQSMWRSFGNMVYDKDEDRIPGIIKWYKKISNEFYNEFKDVRVSINSVSMQDDGNATSWVPVDEICDSININEILITDDKEDGWVDRITKTVETTKRAISFTYYNFMMDIRKIRNLESTALVDRSVEELYFMIDLPFRDWISSIDPDDSMDEKIIDWNKFLKETIEQKAEEIMLTATNRDYVGAVIENKNTGEKKNFNIANAYSKFKHFINITLKV